MVEAAGVAVAVVVAADAADAVFAVTELAVVAAALAVAVAVAGRTGEDMHEWHIGGSHIAEEQPCSA